jgi:hypothetical protein
VAKGVERRDNSLESRTAAAHRAYLEALADWEHAFDVANCPACRAAAATDRERAHRCAAAEAEKERRRVVFRDLCDELGYVPRGRGAALPATERLSLDG